MAFGAIKKGLGSRLAQAREALTYTQKQFADLTEIPLPTLKDYEGGKSIPGGEALAKIGFIGVSLEYVLFGEGSALTAAKKSSVARGAMPDLSKVRFAGGQGVREPGAGYVYVPLYDVRAAAGTGRAVPSAELVVSELAFREDWIRNSLHAQPGDLTLVYIEGDSGEPDLRSGDIVLVNHKDTTATRDAFYVIRMDDALLVKQLQRLPGGVLKASSRNAAYEPFTIDSSKLNSPDAFAIIGRVVWACRRF